MARFIVGRVLAGIITLLLSSIIIFAMVRFIPGDPVSARLIQGGVSEHTQAALRKLYGLDQPIYQQYWTWITSVLHGDLGSSLVTHSSVVNEVLARIPRTIYLAALGMLMALLIAIPAAIVSVRHEGRRVDSSIGSMISVSIAVPNFVIGIFLIVLLAVEVQIFPVGGYVDPSTDPLEFLRSIVLPALTIGLPAAAIIARVLRTSLLDELQRDYIRTVEAWGASRQQAIVHHALRNAAVPTVTVVGLQIGYLLGGAIVVELIFSYPGIGLLLLNSITERDYPTIQGCLLFFALAFVVVNLVTDLVSAALNPQLKVGR